MLLNGILLTPILCLPLLALARSRRQLHGIHVVGALVLMVLTLFAGWQTAWNGTLQSERILSLYCDAFTALMLLIIGVVGFFISLYTVEYLNRELHAGDEGIGRLRIFYLLIHSFFFAMLLCVLSANMGVMWIAMEATTLASAFLVGFHTSKRSMEAAWKYMTICSVGIALAMLGVVFLHLSAAALTGLPGYRELNWAFLYSCGAQLNPAVVKLAMIFGLIGFGTKAGLAPMHTWLPDAHSEAPSSVSALLSGVLLNTAVYCLVRLHAISARCIGPAYSGRLLMIFGVLSVIIAAIFILTQRDYKRLLAYSSVEHMGLICLGFGFFSPASVAAVLFHMLNHSVTKTFMFLASGRILQRYGTKEIHRVKGVIQTLPVTGTVFLLGIFAITGFPPFGIFFSKLALLMAIFKGGALWLGIALVALLGLVFAGFAITLLRMVYGPVPERVKDKTPEGLLTRTALISLMTLAVVLGVCMPPILSVLIRQAATVILGGA